MALKVKSSKAELTGMYGEAETETRLPGTKIITKWEFIDEKKAERYKAKVGRNRTFSDMLGSRYGTDMDLGQWVTTHQGIAFDVVGELVDGQHRLDGIIKSKKGQWMLVTRGLSVEAIEVMDRGRMRSLAHMLQVLGYDIATIRGVAIARAMIAGPKGRGRKDSQVTDISLRKFMEQHGESILFSQEVFGYDVGPAQVYAAMARAYYHVKPAQLRRFAEAFKDEIPAKDQQEGDKTARTFAKYIAVNRLTKGRDNRTVLYQKSQNAIFMFLEGQDVEKMYASAEDLFPLPGTKGLEEAPKVTA